MIRFLILTIFLALSSTSAAASECLGLVEKAIVELGPTDANFTYQIQDPKSIKPEWLGGYGLSRIRESDLDEKNEDHTATFTSPTPKQKRLYGAQLIAQKKPGRAWYSMFGPLENALQGDPRAPFVILGRELAVVLGYRMLDENTVLMPTVKRLNWGIRLVNSWLKQDGRNPLPTSYYVQGDDTESKFLSNVQRSKLPISNTLLELAAHDHCFHATQVLEVQDIHQRTLRIAKFFGEYLKFVKNVGLAEISNKASVEVNTRIDALTANVSTEVYMAIALNFLKEDGDELVGLSTRASQNSIILFLNDFNAEYFGELPLWKSFAVAHPKKVENFQIDMEELPGFAMTGEEYLYEILQRRREISHTLRRHYKRSQKK